MRAWDGSHRSWVWASSAMASTASGVSKPAKPETSKLPSACCWVTNQLRAVWALATVGASPQPVYLQPVAASTTRERAERPREAGDEP